MHHWAPSVDDALDTFDYQAEECALLGHPHIASGWHPRQPDKRTTPMKRNVRKAKNH